MDIENLPVTTLKGVGPKVALKLERLGLRSIQDVLFHLPYRYQDRTRISAMGGLRPGQEVLVQGQIDLCEIRFGRRRSLLCRISDGTGALTLRFFHFTAAQKDNLSRGRWIRCFGEARRGPKTLEMVHPEHELFDQQPEPLTIDTLTPVYPATEGVHQLMLRKLANQAVREFLPELQDLLPDNLGQALHLPPLVEALQLIHSPPPGAAVEELLQGRHPAQQRLAFEELLAHHLSLKRLRYKRQQHGAQPVCSKETLVQDFLGRLPFSLTQAQQRVTEEISTDLSKPVPMQRLLQGDVGAGKTVVAAIAALHTIGSGYQVAIMAPTEILAEQHYQNFSNWFAPLSINVDWLSGKMKRDEREAAVSRLTSGEAALVVGTHALFQESVGFSRLALMVIDEQHRFGVHQRLALREKGSHDGKHPHQLIMTATPIPRTLAMTFYADLDLSTLDELPPGRTPVETVVIPDSRRDEVLVRVRQACAAGRQAYWVCPLVEESDSLQAQAATETRERLAEAFPELKVDLVHGRMKPSDKEAAMGSFKGGTTHVLVATTVVEVGVDVPRASLMIIENAERLGLSQLHQLRGRVGRGSDRSSCVLMYHAPLSELARLRLATMRDTHDGFEVARRDLEMRGPGEVLGTRQTGVQNMRIADVLRDQALFPKVEKLAEGLMRDHPKQVVALIKRWLGDSEDYANV
ncbi:MAG: ATP-dependent DNA helicase RecG [Gammaproteobacteria bacterium]|nr:ATP-dependent DNA helicase RecG [Gammaproteobacteria bacterium]